MKQNFLLFFITENTLQTTTPKAIPVFEKNKTTEIITITIYCLENFSFSFFFIVLELTLKFIYMIKVARGKNYSKTND